MQWPTQRREINVNTDCIQDCNTVPYLKHSENIAELESQPLPPLLQQTET